MPQNSKMLMGAVVAAALAAAVYYGMISPQMANNIQTQANQTLGTAPASQQSAAPAPQSPTPQTPAANAPVPQPSSQTPRQ